MPPKSIGETAMTDAERQARYRAARAAGKPVVRVRRVLDHRGRARRWTDHVAALWKHRSSTPPGWTTCRTVFRTARPPKHCGRSAISISLSCRRSNHRAASAGTDKPFTDIAHNGLHRWVHRNPPARRCVSLSIGTPRRAGPPYGLPAQATTQGGQFWTPIGGQYSTPVDTNGGAQCGKSARCVRRGGGWKRGTVEMV